MGLNDVKSGNMFEEFGVKEWVEYYESLNKELSVDKVRLDLTDDEKKAYKAALDLLKRERKKVPEVEYEINYHDFE